MPLDPKMKKYFSWTPLQQRAALHIRPTTIHKNQISHHWNLIMIRRRRRQNINRVVIPT